MIEIIIAIVIGFCAGAIAALVVNEVLMQKVEEKYKYEREQQFEIHKAIEELKEHDRLEDVAIQTMIIKFKKERGAIWESLNGLWNDYDKRNKKEEPAADQVDPEAGKDEPQDAESV